MENRGSATVADFDAALWALLSQRGRETNYTRIPPLPIVCGFCFAGFTGFDALHLLSQH